MSSNLALPHTRYPPFLLLIIALEAQPWCPPERLNINIYLYISLRSLLCQEHSYSRVSTPSDPRIGPRKMNGSRRFTFSPSRMDRHSIGFCTSLIKWKTLSVLRKLFRPHSVPTSSQPLGGFRERFSLASQQESDAMINRLTLHFPAELESYREFFQANNGRYRVCSQASAVR